MILIDRINSFTTDACMTAIDVGVTVKKGVLVVVEEGSRVFYDIYSLDGFEKWSKTLIAYLRFLSYIPKVQGVFDELLKTLEGQKDLYYATLFIGSMKDFIAVHEDGAMSFQIPKVRSGGIDVVKIFYAIGNFFETGKFLQKYQVFSFSLCTQVANRLATIKVFAFRGQEYQFGDIPVLNSLCDRPKDLFIFLASGIELWRCSQRPILEWDNALKLTGNIGKLLLISLSGKFSRTWWFASIDVVTQSVSLAKFILDRHNGRVRRFDHPTAPAAV